MTLWGRNQFNRDYELGGYGGIECFLTFQPPFAADPNVVG